MIKKQKDIQLLLDFNTPGQKIKFTSYKVVCRCGYSCELSKADIVIEMTVPCSRCGHIITIK